MWPIHRPKQSTLGKHCFVLLNTTNYVDPQFHCLIDLTKDQREEVRWWSHLIHKIMGEMRANVTEQENCVTELTMENEPAHGTCTLLTVLGKLFGDVYCKHFPCESAPTAALIEQRVAVYKQTTLWAAIHLSGG